MNAEKWDVPPGCVDCSLTVLVHGASKSGKSTLSVTCVAPRLYFDVESASRFLPIKRVVWDPVNPPPEYDGTWDTAVVQTRSWTDVERAYQWLDAGRHPFRSVVIDSISELQNRFIEQEAGRHQPTMQQYGSAYRAVGGLVRDIRDLTMHPTKPIEQIVIVAMTRQGKDDKWRPWLVGQVATVLPYLLDITGYLYVDTEVNELTGESREVRKLLTRGTPNFEAGERVGGRVDRIVVEPRLDQLLHQVFPEDYAPAIDLSTVGAETVDTAEPAAAETTNDTSEEETTHAE